MSSTDEIPVGAVLSNQDIVREMAKYPNIHKYPLVANSDGTPLDFDDKDSSLLWECCVDLRIGRIYVGDPTQQKRYREIKDEDDKLYLAPGAIVHVESRERVSTPPDIMGILIPKNTKSEAGLLMLNAGHVDPGWEGGFLTAEIMNVTAEEFLIEIGEALFSIIFQYIHTPASRTSKAHDTPTTDEERRKKAGNLAAKRPTSLHQYYRDELIKAMRAEFATRGEVAAAGMTRLTIFVVILSSMMALGAGIALAFALWQMIN